MGQTSEAWKSRKAWKRSGRVKTRSASPGDELRTHRLSVRVTRRISAEVASIQGLCLAHGRQETLAALFETVALPAIRAHVRPYAERAKAERLAAKEPSVALPDNAA